MSGYICEVCLMPHEDRRRVCERMDCPGRETFTPMGLTVADLERLAADKEKTE